MDYEKAYKDALERAKRLYKDAVTLQLEQDIKDYETIFPELKESENERMRKEIIEFVKSRGGFKQEYIAWLEKQGEQEPTPIEVEVGYGFAAEFNALLKKYEHLSKRGTAGAAGVLH